MEKEKDFFIEDLLKSTEGLIEEIDSENLKSGISEHTSEKISEEVREKEIESLGKEYELIVHGYADIRISDDDMVVMADFYPPTHGGVPVKKKEIRDHLESLGVVYGIDWEAIDRAIEQCNNELEPVTDVVIARGDRPIDQVPEHLVIEEHLLEKPAGPEGQEKPVDYRELTTYTLIKKGETLAHIVPFQKGKEGRTVKGKLLPFRKVPVSQIKPGVNTEVAGDRVIASCDGRFERSVDLILVREVFEIFGNVDYKTGNISFPGDVIIHGHVSDGFKVESGASIVCHETLDASEVVCRGDLIVNRGIIGRNKGSVKVGGSIKAKYIENCYVEADGKIFVDAGILHSMILTHKTLEMGRKSIIVGGKITAQNGVIAFNVGNRMGIKTEISCGVDYSVQQKIGWINEKTVALAKKLNQIERGIRKKAGDIKKLYTMKEKIAATIHKLNEALKTLMKQQSKSEAATVIVKGTVYPGVYIEICSSSYVVSREIASVRFRLDRESEKIVAEPYAKDLF